MNGSPQRLPLPDPGSIGCWSGLASLSYPTGASRQAGSQKNPSRSCRLTSHAHEPRPATGVATFTRRARAVEGVVARLVRETRNRCGARCTSAHRTPEIHEVRPSAVESYPGNCQPLRGQGGPRTDQHWVSERSRGGLALLKRGSCNAPEGVLHPSRGGRAPLQRGSCTPQEGVLQGSRGACASPPTELCAGSQYTSARAGKGLRRRALSPCRRGDPCAIKRPSRHTWKPWSADSRHTPGSADAQTECRTSPCAAEATTAGFGLLGCGVPCCGSRRDVQRSTTPNATLTWTSGLTVTPMYEGTSIPNAFMFTRTLPRTTYAEPLRLAS